MPSLGYIGAFSRELDDHPEGPREPLASSIVLELSDLMLKVFYPQDSTLI